MSSPKTSSTQTQSREEEADLTLRKTVVSRRLALTMVVIFLLLIALPPIVQHFRGPKLKKSDSTFWSLFPSSSEVEKVRGVRSATALLPTDIETKRVETRIEKQALLSQRLLSPSQNVMSGVFQAGNEQVYMGRDKWLFAKAEVDYLTGKGFLDPDVLRRRATKGVQPNPLKAILDFDRQLKAHGIKLIVMPIPSKATIHPDKFGASSTRLAPENASFARFTNELRRNKIAVYDAAPTLLRAREMTQEPQYFAGDTHWTPQAMTRVARDLASFVRENTDLPAQTPTIYKLSSSNQTNICDLEIMLKLPKQQRIFPRQRAKVDRVLDARGNLWQPQPDADILLLGDSFSIIYSRGGSWGRAAGLGEHLSFYLQRPIDSLAINGGAANFVRRRWQSDLKSGKRSARKVRVVIYEFAARTLVNNNWKLVDMSKSLAASKAAPAVPVKAVVKNRGAAKGSSSGTRRF